MKILARAQKTILSAAVIIGVSSLASRLLGLVRDRILADSFGAGQLLDAYYAAFRIPDFVFNILVAGTIAAAFIPVFSKLYNKVNRDKAWQLTNSVLTVIGICLMGLGVALYFVAPYVARYITPGFDPETINMMIWMTRIMLLSPVIFGISSIIGSVLNALQRFVAYAIAPIFYNLGIIVGALWFVPLWGPLGLAYGVVLGAILHLLIQIPSMAGTGWRFKFQLGRDLPETKKVAKLMLPRIIGGAATQINLIVSTGVASTLVIGSVAVFNFANNLQSFPLGIFGISFSVAAFPAMAHAVARARNSEFVEKLSKTFRQVLYLIVPASIFIILLRAQIVRLILGTGAFDWEDTVLTAATLGFFAVSLFAQSTIPLLAKAFYALHDTRTPVIVSIFSMVLNVILTVVLGKTMGVEGIALAFSIAAGLNMLFLLGLLRMRAGDMQDKQIIISAFKTLIISLVAGIALYGSLYFFDIFVDTHTYTGLLLQTLGAGLVGIAIYWLGSFIFKNEEVPIGQFIRTLVNKRRNGKNININDQP
ncbi:murein biosynthesis integral membrane protein MurJ [Patescibacteria group bacterium]